MSYDPKLVAVERMAHAYVAARNEAEALWDAPWVGGVDPTRAAVARALKQHEADRSVEALHRALNAMVGPSMAWRLIKRAIVDAEAAR